MDSALILWIEQGPEVYVDETLGQALQYSVIITQWDTKSYKYMKYLH